LEQPSRRLQRSDTVVIGTATTLLSLAGHFIEVTASPNDFPIAHMITQAVTLCHLLSVPILIMVL
jgi:hypothetical protein